MLDDRLGAIVAKVADRDAGSARRSNIDIVDTGRRQRDQPELGVGRDGRAIEIALFANTTSKPAMRSSTCAVAVCW